MFSFSTDNDLASPTDASANGSQDGLEGEEQRPQQVRLYFSLEGVVFRQSAWLFLSYLFMQLV
jgi:hypothetical protein